ncbi:RNA polymerase sigma factor [Echinicola shivajiensis]|uniref:RNA polymerase sigma factor n=1 Tax=Echinicola shivajiensis TaxID=1035916 RepID=UPI001BFCAAA3|nr:RNA polymerase sigma factor [Echinicola shivajiensis]
MKIIGSNVIKINDKDAINNSPSIKRKGYNELDDFELWSKFKDGDESAFVQIYNEHFEYLCHFGVQYAQLHIVEDCVQDLFIELRKKRQRLPEINHSIRFFLFQAIKRRIFNVLKKDKKSVCSDMIDKFNFEIIPPQETLIILNQIQKEKLEKLDRALKGLNDKQREVIYYFFYKGMSYEEVQRMMGYSHVKSARNMIYKIIGTLKKVFVLTLIMVS